MAIYKKVKLISSETAAYIAGIIDGEGTISLSRRHKKDNRQLVISISNNELSLLKYIKKIVGAGRLIRKRVYSDKHSPSYAYVIENRQALNLLEQTAIYLRTYKAKRAKLVLKYYIQLTPRNGKYTPSLLKMREAFIKKFLKLNPRYIN